MRERILAVVGAICLVAVAVLVRQWLSDRGDDAPTGSRSSGGGAPVVACTPDLAPVCDALAAAGAIAADPPELDGAAAAEPDEGIDAWITWDPGPQLAGFDADGRSATAVWTEVEVLATAPLAAAGATTVLGEACGSSTTWACLAEAGSAEDAVKVGVGDPDSAEGIARLLPVARALSDGDDPRTGDVALRALLRAPTEGQAAAPAMATSLATRPGEVEVVVGPQGLLDATAATAQGRAREIEVRTPEPAASLAVVVAGRTSGVAERIAERCDAAADPLAAAGLTATCTGGDTIDDDLAGFLWQVRGRVL